MSNVSRHIKRMLHSPRGKGLFTAALFVVGFWAAAQFNHVTLSAFSFKDAIGCVTVALSVSSLGHFVFDAVWGDSRPHIYSWLIWTVVNGVAWLNQWTHHAGPGAWSTLVMTILSGAIFGIACFQYATGASDHKMTRIDQWCLGGAAVSIVLLVLYKTGPVSILAATVTDVFAFAPTLQKIWKHPYSEPASNYSLNTLRHTIALSAMGSYNFVTLLFPASLIFFNGLTVTAIVVRRRQLRSSATQRAAPSLEQQPQS